MILVNANEVCFYYRVLPSKPLEEPECEFSLTFAIGPAFIYNPDIRKLGPGCLGPPWHLNMLFLEMKCHFPCY